MKKLLLIILILHVTQLLYAQTSRLSGTIRNQEGAPVPALTVSLEATNYQTATDDSGSFEFGNVKAGDYMINVNGIHYNFLRSPITVKQGASAHLNLQISISTQQLKEVTISARQTSSAVLTRTNTPLKDIPQNIQTIDRKLLDEQQAFTIDEALKNASGISFGSAGSINMRGFTTNNRDFLTNGLKGSPYPEGEFPLLGNIERVEVIHGASAILLGEGAVGGNINLVTKQPKKSTMVNGSIGAGSLNLFRTMADVTGSLNQSRSLYFLAGAAYQSGGRFTRNFDYRTLQLYGSLKWELAPKTTWQINLNYNHDDATSNFQPDIPVYTGDDPRLFSLPNDFTYARANQRYKGENFQVQSLMEHTFSTNWKANLAIAFSQGKADRKQYAVYNIAPETNLVSGSYTIQQLNTPTITINPYVTGNFSTWTVKHKVVTGFDATLTRGNYPDGIKLYRVGPLNVLNPDLAEFGPGANKHFFATSTEKFTYNSVAGYVQDQIEIVSQLKALLGLRYNNFFRRYLAINESDGSIRYDERPDRSESFIPRVGVVYQPFESASFYADYNKGFIPQYSNERKYGGPFDPEITNQFEFGYKGEIFNKRLRPSVTLYHIVKNNVLTYYEDESLPDGFGYRPLQAVTSKGIELSLTGNVTSDLFVVANYSYTNAKISESSEATDIGQRFVNSPKDIASGWVSYTFSKVTLKGLNLGAGLNYVGARTAYFGTLPSYTLADAYIGYRLKNYQLQLNGNNLFDQTYALNGGYSAYTPGAPRSILISLAYHLK